MRFYGIDGGIGGGIGWRVGVCCAPGAAPASPIVFIDGDSGVGGGLCRVDPTCQPVGRRSNQSIQSTSNPSIHPSIQQPINHLLRRIQVQRGLDARQPAHLLLLPLWLIFAIGVTTHTGSINPPATPLPYKTHPKLSFKRNPPPPTHLQILGIAREAVHPLQKNIKYIKYNI